MRFESTVYVGGQRKRGVGEDLRAIVAILKRVAEMGLQLSTQTRHSKHSSVVSFAKMGAMAEANDAVGSDDDQELEAVRLVVLVVELLLVLGGPTNFEKLSIHKSINAWEGVLLPRNGRNESVDVAVESLGMERVEQRQRPILVDYIDGFQENLTQRTLRNVKEWNHLLKTNFGGH